MGGKNSSIKIIPIIPFLKGERVVSKSKGEVEQRFFLDPPQSDSPHIDFEEMTRSMKIGFSRTMGSYTMGPRQIPYSCKIFRIAFLVRYFR